MTQTGVSPGSSHIAKRNSKSKHNRKLFGSHHKDAVTNHDILSVANNNNNNNNNKR